MRARATAVRWEDRRSSGTSRLARRGALSSRILFAAIASLLVARPAAALLPVANASGDALYQRECAPCHGLAGHGDGPEAKSFAPPPRDLQKEFIDRYPESQLAKRLRNSRLLILTIDPDAIAERRKQMAEAIVDHLQRLPDVDWPLVRRGADVYAERCESCHGAYGRPGVPSLLQQGPQPSGRQPAPDFQKAVGDEELLRAAGGAHVALPGFAPVMDDGDAKALLAYLRLLSPGFARYSVWCAPCHGDGGAGDGVFATDVDKPNVALDRAYLKSQTPSELRRKILHVVTQDEAALPHYQRQVSINQAHAIVAALRASRAAMSAGTATTAPAAATTPAVAASPTPLPTPALAARQAPRVKKPGPSATPRGAKTAHVKKKPPTPAPHASSKAPAKKTPAKPKPKPKPAADEG
jgi:mono/diheme cytochrome c family protein